MNVGVALKNNSRLRKNGNITGPLGNIHLLRGSLDGQVLSHVLLDRQAVSEEAVFCPYLMKELGSF